MADAPFKGDDFSIWVPDAVKADEREGKRWIGGYASTEHMDRQGEVVLQRGLDFSEFTQFGYYNDNHKQETGAVVGVPELARYDVGKGWWTEGYLLKGVPRADEIWRLAHALKDTDRKLGFSIEGKVLERRDGNMITKARIRHVAVTNSPVNTNCTWEVLTKSFCLNCDKKECNNCGHCQKALEVGHEHPPTEGGKVVVPDDLEKDETSSDDGSVDYLYQCRKCQKAFVSQQSLDAHAQSKHPVGQASNEIRRLAKALTTEEAVAMLLRLRPHWSPDTCRRVVDLASRGA